MAVGSYFFLRQPKSKFQGFYEASMSAMSYDQILSGRLYYVAEVKILRKLSNKEKMKIASEFNNASSYTFFEARINHDYLQDKDLKEKIYVSQFGTDEWQLRGYPIFKEGDTHLLILGKDNPNFEYYTVYGGPNGAFDVVEKNGEKYIYKRFGVFYELRGISIQMDDDESKAYPNGKENPAFYSQKFRISDFGQKIKTDYESKKGKK